MLAPQFEIRLQPFVRVFSQLGQRFLNDCVALDVFDEIHHFGNLLKLPKSRGLMTRSTEEKIVLELPHFETFSILWFPSKSKKFLNPPDTDAVPNVWCGVLSSKHAVIGGIAPVRLEATP